MKVRAQVLISGRVQGVFFRWTILDQAKKHNVTGWVQNTLDGRVKAIFEGEKKDVETMIDVCKSGPPAAKVTDVELKWKEYVGNIKAFKIRRSHTFENY
jgi:acylphosphatase